MMTLLSALLIHSTNIVWGTLAFVIWALGSLVSILD